jgi:hypothetical protein
MVVCGSGRITGKFEVACNGDRTGEKTLGNAMPNRQTGLKSVKSAAFVSK